MLARFLKVIPAFVPVLSTMSASVAVFVHEIRDYVSCNTIFDVHEPFFRAVDLHIRVEPARAVWQDCANDLGNQLVRLLCNYAHTTRHEQPGILRHALCAHRDDIDLLNGALHKLARRRCLECRHVGDHRNSFVDEMKLVLADIIRESKGIHAMQVHNHHFLFVVKCGFILLRNKGTDKQTRDS